MFWSLGEFSLGEFPVTIIPPIPPTPVLVQSGYGVLPRKRKILDDDEVIILIAQQLAQQFWKEKKKN